MLLSFNGRSKGGALGGPGPPPYFGFTKKKESKKEEKPVGQATKNCPSPLDQGLDPPLS